MSADDQDPTNGDPDVDTRHARGMQVGDHNVQTNYYFGQADSPVRSAYLEQVRRIAPDVLYNRAPELAELAAFCTQDGPRPYVWWQAPAWAGKSALMSWFVLHPPPAVRVVSFFITARFAGQSDRVAFVDNVLPQLAEILKHRGKPAYLTDSTCDAYLLDMLTDAARTCWRQGERLVLVLDGLDEDRGVVNTSDAYSVAALLPERPPAEMRVIVTGRPHWSVPDDVADNHPLRDTSIVRVLNKSAHAKVIRSEAARELDRLLEGTKAEQDVLGLLVAAGGGLSLTDLNELTDLSPRHIHKQLRAGRTYARRGSLGQSDTGTEVYLLAHEELYMTAARFIGKSRINDYQQRLHTWADDYREQQWPIGTPEYLLGGYYDMLQTTGDLQRMIACAGDPTRHDRMLEISGGDHAASIEITTAMNAIVACNDPDLAAMARLAIHRDNLADRNSCIPPDLPVAWAIIGRPARAEALARSITPYSWRSSWLLPTEVDPDLQGQALIALTKALAKAGDFARAEAMARSITNVARKAQAWTSLIGAAAGSDRNRLSALAEQAEMAARLITSPLRQAQALNVLAKALAAAGESVRADAVTRSITGQDGRTQALVAPVAYSDTDRHNGLARWITSPDRHAWALASLIEMARSITDPCWQAQALTSLIEAVAVIGDLERVRAVSVQAETAALSISNEYRRAEVLAALAKAVAATGDRDRATKIAEQAEAVARSITDPERQARAQMKVLVAYAGALAADGNTDRAELLARSISDREERMQVLISLVMAVAATGDIDRARRLASQVETTAQSMPPHSRIKQLANLARALATIGDTDRAKNMAKQAERVARSNGDRYVEAGTIAAVVETFAVVGEIDRAELLARSTTDSNAQASLVKGLVVVDEIDRAKAVAHQLQIAAMSISNQYQHEVVLTALATAVTAVGETERGELLAMSIIDPQRQTSALAAVAVQARRKDPARARILLARAFQIGGWLEPLAALVEVDPSAVTQIADIAGLKFHGDNQRRR